jgi:hypothetical protein
MFISTHGIQHWQRFNDPSANVLILVGFLFQILFSSLPTPLLRRLILATVKIIGTLSIIAAAAATATLPPFQI